MERDHFKTIEFADIRNRLKRAIGLVLASLLLAASSAQASDLAVEKADAEPVYKYTGNSFSLKFHRPTCKFARAMWREHIVRFTCRQQAVDAGQRPCRYCLPPDWKSVGARIIGRPSSAVLENVSGLNAGTLKLQEAQQTEILEPGSSNEGRGMRAIALPLSDTTNQQLPKEPSSPCTVVQPSVRPADMPSINELH